MYSRKLTTVGLLFLAAVLGGSAAAGGGSRDRDPCTEHIECNDDNVCTEDYCSPEGVCFNWPNYDEVSMCCHPLGGGIVPIDCEDPGYCYDPICYPGSCICCDRPDGDPCADGAIPTISAWGAVAMVLLLLTAGTVVLLRRSYSQAPETRPW